MEQTNYRNQEQETMPLWRQLVMCFQGAKGYPAFLKMKSNAIVKYVFFLGALIAIFSVYVPLTGVLVGVGGIGAYIEERVPEFTLANGTLQMGAPVSYVVQGMKVYIDTSVEEYEKKDIDNSLYVQVLGSKTNILVYSNGMVYNYRLADFSQLSLTKDTLLDSVPLFYVGLAIYVIISYIGQILSLLMTALMLALVGCFTRSLYGFSIGFSDLMKLAIYSTTIVTILDALNMGLHLGLASMVNIVGMLWTAFVFFGAVRYVGFSGSGAV